MLDSLLKQTGAPAEIDYLSIDIEGAEERALLDFDFDSYRFKCISIERPSEALRRLFADNAYVLVKEIPGLDCFYVHQSHLHQYRINAVDFYRKRFFAFRWW